jgi:hypothetical protein
VTGVHCPWSRLGDLVNKILLRMYAAMTWTCCVHPATVLERGVKVINRSVTMTKPTLKWLLAIWKLTGVKVRKGFNEFGVGLWMSSNH